MVLKINMRLSSTFVSIQQIWDILSENVGILDQELSQRRHLRRIRYRDANEQITFDFLQRRNRTRDAPEDIALHFKKNKTNRVCAKGETLRAKTS